MTWQAPLVLAALAALAAPPAQAQYCFELIGPNQALVSRGTVSPVDLSLPIGQALQARGLGDHHLLYYPDDGDCQPLPGRPAVVAPRAAESAADLAAILNGIEDRHGPRAFAAYMRDTDVEWRRVFTGPRGGRYTVTDNGHKNYLGRRDQRRHQSHIAVR